MESITSFSPSSRRNQSQSAANVLSARSSVAAPAGLLLPLYYTLVVWLSFGPNHVVFMAACYFFYTKVTEGTADIVEDVYVKQPDEEVLVEASAIPSGSNDTTSSTEEALVRSPEVLPAPQSSSNGVEASRISLPSDPRAALFGQIMGRRLSESSSSDDDDKPVTPFNPRAALLAQLSSRKSEDGSREADKPVVPFNPRAALLAQLQKKEDGPAGSSSPRPAIPVNPRAALMAQLRKKEDGSAEPSMTFNARAALMAQLSSQKVTDTDENKNATGSADALKAAYLAAVAKNQPRGPPPATLKEMPEFQSYFNMLRLGCPQDAVKHKILMDGADPIILTLGPDAIFEEVKDKIKMVNMSKLKDEIKDVKTRKETDKDAPKALQKAKEEPPAESKSAAEDSVLLKDHDVYAKYFRMRKMGLPEGAVRQIMELEGVNTRALELGPNATIGQLNQLSAAKPKPKEVVKRRRKKLHWQPIPEERLSSVNQQTIWETDKLEFEMDMDELEALFFATVNEASKKASPAAKTLKLKQSVTLIDPKRAMNAAISLARVKLNYAEIAEAIKSFDPKGLTVQQLRGICEFLPTEEEANAVTTYTGDHAMLGEAEKFMLAVSKVKRYIPRTECLVFKMSFPSRCEELKVSLGHLTGACDEVKGSRLLKTLLTMVLKLGNTLNGSGEENEIRGFTVDSLLRLGHTKAVNQKTTVLHYLVRLVKKNHPAVLDFHKELKSVPSAARESFELVTEDSNRLQAGLTQLTEEFNAMKKDGAFSDPTFKALESAVEEIEAEMNRIQSSIKQAREAVQSVFEYFGEDPEKNPNEFFTTLSSFCTEFETARRDVDAIDEAARRTEMLRQRRHSFPPRHRARSYSDDATKDGPLAKLTIRTSMCW
ncbi:hypothetical protein Poli38472_004518 [Pythium oligandrum]|uniref:FH2 domain-containing protein n=1 Tax=Pythium oligandrum TaxID=41045 RepID=A0A8K1CAG6_PYTOL|nr:hypothetical protein Poli38472_004518 [Pythium oligandrum]|eukprot:TMW59449.1 hypothetical protein Poli38472_004518 [Pythium oligandrum]